MEYVIVVVVVLGVIALLQRRVLARGTDSSVVSETGEGTPVRVLSMSTTTGWADWIHGELLLLPDGLLRIRQNLRKTFVKGNASLVDGEAIEIVADPAKLDAAKQQRRNRYVPGTAIATYDLQAGATAGVLRLQLHDGGRQKLLFLPDDMDVGTLETALRDWGVRPLTPDAS